MTARRIDSPEIVEILGTEGFPGQIERLTSLATEMAQGGIERDEPVREVFSLLGDRWSALVLLVLEAGRIRHAGLRRMISRLSGEGSISQRVMTLKLRALERDGFVKRIVSNDTPPRVDYELTALGGELVGRIRSLIDWINQRRAQIEQARTSFTDN